MKPLRKKRRICGLNAYVQSQLKGCGLRIGSDEYRCKVREVHSAWKSMSDIDKAEYDQLASSQQEQVSALANLPLSAQVPEGSHLLFGFQ